MLNLSGPRGDWQAALLVTLLNQYSTFPTSSMLRPLRLQRGQLRLTVPFDLPVRLLLPGQRIGARPRMQHCDGGAARKQAQDPMHRIQPDRV
jgi:hypothetical protein